jgi:S1-C subfamily serine protease
VLIGINAMIIGRGTGIGFAIPSDLARHVADQLVADGRVHRAWLGVTFQEMTPELASFLEKSVETFLVQQDSLQAQISKMVANTPLATMADLTRQNIDALAKMQENVLSALLAKRERMRDEDEKRT